MNDFSDMRLDLSDGEGNSFYDNRKDHATMQINEIYGPESLPQDYKRSFYYKYLRVFGDCLSKVFSCGPNLCPRTVIQVPQGMIGMKKEAGVYVEKMRPGIHSINPLLHKIEMVDLRAQSLQLPHQDVLTKDNVTFDIDALINYRIRSPEVAIYKLNNHRRYVSNIAASALRAVISVNTFSEVLEHRERINQAMLEYMEARLETWGLEVDFVETQSIHLAEELHMSMAVVAESQTKAQGKIVDALGHLESSKVFTEAAREFELNVVSIDLQKWEVLSSLKNRNSLAIVVPHDMLGRVRSLFGESNHTPKLMTKNPFDE